MQRRSVLVQPPADGAEALHVCILNRSRNSAPQPGKLANGLAGFSRALTAEAPENEIGAKWAALGARDGLCLLLGVDDHPIWCTGGAELER